MGVTHKKKFKCAIIASFTLYSIVVSQVVQSEADWSSVTIDNDLFVGSDNGYTNGIYYSWFDTPANDSAVPGILARSMLWSFSEDEPVGLEVSIKTIGQTMISPDNITLENPPLPPDDLPYAGLLFYSDTYIKYYQKSAEKISVTIGVIGKYSFAENSQKLVHGITGSDQPEGWVTQLDDEVVFQFSHARVWKSWSSDSDRADILLGTGAALGTISSSIGAAVMFRYGSQLNRTFATALLVNSRTTNPVAIDSGWYLFAGAEASYVVNQIFLDGNTFDDDESIDYDGKQLGVTFGLAYSWQNLSLTFAINDLNLNKSGSDPTVEYSEYGTFTLAWRHD